MPQFSKPTFSLLLIIIVVISIPTIQFEYGSSTIQLPFEYADATANLCANNKNGLVPRPAFYPVKCFRANPVCNIDGMTYWCGYADALCTNVKVARLGFCEVGNGGPGPLSGQALLLIHIVWLIVLGFFMLFRLF
ncbi:hypothetical protein RGQ29_022043 [Quercus rubra]|uniref:Transmembrane protein n=1 Tax=Quercus rubra TaxID=3512 RepID=A0AAN7F1X5_QUERU|nr:hypothetical protein RGQ29_022043 [Quercus rubra]